MPNSEIDVVTGAFGFSGKYIAKRLLDAGCRVRTLTNSANRENPFGGKIEVYPYNFDHPERLAESMRGASVLYNNYWVRFNYSGHTSFTFAKAVENSLILFEAAKKAGIKRIVHISITNPSETSPFEYFRGKAMLEKAVKGSGLPYAILRPAVLFGREDILINNIAWLLRKFPVFGVFGKGDYRLQPIYVQDLAELVFTQGQAAVNTVIDAVGPETFTFMQLVETIGKAIGKPRPVISISPALGFAAGWLVGKMLGDIVITRDEIEGLMAGLLYTGSPPAGETRLTDWVTAHSSSVGKHYSSELARRTNRTASYEKL